MYVCLCVIILFIYSFISEEQKYVCSGSYVESFSQHKNFIFACLYYVTVFGVGCISFTVVSLRKVVLSPYAFVELKAK